MVHTLLSLHSFFLFIINHLKSLFGYNDATQPQSQEIEVLHQNENFLVVNKPFDLLINSEDTNEQDTLHLRLKKQYPTLVCKNVKFGFYFPHRLDYSTSGLMMIALNKTSCNLMCTCFEKAKVKKYYLALVRGIVSKDILDIHDPIGYNRQELNYSNAMCSPEFNEHCIHAKSAHTRLLVLSYGLYMSYPCTKVLVRIITGRRHQIRVHCSNMGHTIVGDYTYSRRKEVEPPRQMLHAYRLKVESIPNFDFQTEDPFHTKVLSGWTELKTIKDLKDENVFDNL